MYVKLIEATPARSAPFGLGGYGVFYDDGLPVVDPDAYGQYTQVVFSSEEEARAYVDSPVSRYAVRVYRDGVYAWTDWYATDQAREAWLESRIPTGRYDFERVNPYDVLPD